MPPRRPRSHQEHPRSSRRWTTPCRHFRCLPTHRTTHPMIHSTHRSSSRRVRRPGFRRSRRMPCPGRRRGPRTLRREPAQSSCASSPRHLTLVGTTRSFAGAQSAPGRPKSSGGAPEPKVESPLLRAIATGASAHEFEVGDVAGEGSVVEAVAREKTRWTCVLDARYDDCTRIVHSANLVARTRGPYDVAIERAGFVSARATQARVQVGPCSKSGAVTQQQIQVELQPG